MDSITKVKIICPFHGVFEQTPNAHLSNKKCYLCTGTPKKTTEKFILDANKIHKSKYEYSLVEYNKNSDKIKIICKKHGEFIQTPAAHLRGQGCPTCRDSKGESIIKEFLISNKISFMSQKRFPDCINILPLPFDFYLPQFNTCIEYQGIQHFKPRTKFGGVEEFKKIQIRDNIKLKYCKNNNINLLTINYDENILDKLLNFSTNIFKTTTQSLIIVYVVFICIFIRNVVSQNFVF